MRMTIIFPFFFQSSLRGIDTEVVTLSELLCLPSAKGFILEIKKDFSPMDSKPLRKHAYIILTPLKPHFYIVKLGFIGVYTNFLISAQNIDCGYSLEPPH